MSRGKDIYLCESALCTYLGSVFYAYQSCRSTITPSALSRPLWCFTTTCSACIPPLPKKLTKLETNKTGKLAADQQVCLGKGHNLGGCIESAWPTISSHGARSTSSGIRRSEQVKIPYCDIKVSFIPLFNHCICMDNFGLSYLSVFSFSTYLPSSTLGSFCF